MKSISEQNGYLVSMIMLNATDENFISTSGTLMLNLERMYDSNRCYILYKRGTNSTVSCIVCYH